MAEVQPGTAKPPTNDEPPAAPAEAPKGGVKAVAREAVQAYRNINKVDKWGGGGFTLSTLVKLAGWAGLISILAVLVMKLREVEEQLDPVTSIVTKLMKEVEASRLSVKHHTQETQVELEALRREAADLKASVAKTGEAQLEAQHALDEVELKARALSERLEQESARSAGLGAQGDTATETLRAYAKTLGEMESQLKATSDQAAANVRALAESVKKTNDQVAELQKILAGVQSSTAPASLAKLDAAAKDLTQALDRASTRVKTLDGVPAASPDKKAPKTPDSVVTHGPPAPVPAIGPKPSP